MKIYQALLRHRADNYVATTYNVDLPFFEHMLFERLYRNGCYNTTLLCDPNQYQLALQDIPALRHLGHRYVCVPCTIAKSVFHPKLTILTSAEAGLLLLGSNNISRPGFMRNLEVATKFEYATNDSDDDLARTACRWAYDYLLELAKSQHDPVLDERLDRLWSTTGWLRRDPNPSTFKGCWLLHNLNRPILSQLVDHWQVEDGSRVREAVIVSPYFDREAAALDMLLRKLEPEAVSLVTQPRDSGMDPDKVHTVLDDAGVSWSIRQLDMGARRLHAKVLALRTERGSWVLSGSPNFSRPALLRSSSDGNAELAVLRYEPDPSYPTPFFRPVLEASHELDLEWEVSEEPAEESEDPPFAYRVAQASFENDRLSVVVHPAVPDGTRLKVALSGPGNDLLEEVRWYSDGPSVTLELSNEAKRLFRQPASIRLIIESAEGRAYSTLAVVNNQNALRDTSQQARPGQRRRIPENMVPGSVEQALELMETLYDLLAMNVQQLRRHRGISERAARDLKREGASTPEVEDYAPEDVIVDEQLQPVRTAKASDLYIDYYDRLTYQDLLRAARAVTYQPESQSQRGETPAEDPEPPRPRVRTPPEGRPRSQDDLKRIFRSFSRLVTNYERGVQDEAYMAEVPPAYYRRNFVVLVTLLRNLWLDEMIRDDDFLTFSERLFTAFLGDGREPGGRALIAQRTGANERTEDEEQLRLPEQCWLHLYLMVKCSRLHAENRLPNLAVLLRHVARELGPPTVLEGLPSDSLTRMWLHGFANSPSSPDARRLVADLEKYSQWYSEPTLRRELMTLLRGVVTIEPINLKSGAVTCLRIDAPWEHEDLDTCWWGFVNFCRWPEWKRKARLEAYDTNLKVSGFESRRLVIFYEGDREELKIAAKLNGETAMRTVPGVTLKHLIEMRSFQEAWDNGLTVSFKRT